MKNILYTLAVAFFVACSTSSNDSEKDKNIAPPTSASILDSSSVRDTSKAFALAIVEYMKAVEQKEKLKFDTLCFIQNIEFPKSVKLPANIGTTAILMVPSEKSFIYKGRSLGYLNMFGWINDIKAEFVFVQFDQNGVHQYDYFIDYVLNSKTKEYQLENIRFENWRTKSKELLYGKKS